MGKSNRIPRDYFEPPTEDRKVGQVRKWLKRVFIALLFVYFVGGLWLEMSMNYAVIQFVPERQFFPVCVVVSPTYRGPKPRLRPPVPKEDL